jgi:hypothetical protein
MRGLDPRIHDERQQVIGVAENNTIDAIGMKNPSTGGDNRSVSVQLRAVGLGNAWK